MTRNTVCPTVQAYRVFKVAEQRKVPVVMYDYYDSCKFQLKSFHHFSLTDLFLLSQKLVVLECFTNLFQPTFATFASQTTAKINVLRIQVGVAMKTDLKDGERWTGVATAALPVASSHCSRRYSVSFCRVSQVLYS